MIIDQQEEFTRDWDWYAVDENGHVGHFTSAGLRSLPRSMKQDQEAVESLREYFFKTAPVTGPFRVRLESESDCGGWEKQGRERYLPDFVLMASKGLFSFDTSVRRGPSTDYFLVACPECPLTVANVPTEIRSLLLRTLSTLRFAGVNYVPSLETENW